ncbi:MAG: BREX system P-loop protein BrxC, partial [Desulfosalsimonas sp.]
METIKQLFDPKKDIYRSIEKVITYDASQEHRLKNEISEYIVTESIEEQFEKLLTRMQTAMESGNENDIGVWVSGFYGSGKSSFTKYLGLALDEQVQIEGIPFINHLQDRLNKPQTKALLTTVARRFPAAVIMLDLASEMLAGATMQEVSTVLYYKVLQWAGYSRNLKVAAFERRLQKDGRYDEFLKKIEDQGLNWADIQNDPLVVDSVIPSIAHEMYPEIFRTETAFNSEASDIITFENERVKEMIEIVYNKTGKSHIIFIIDEVGQYLGGRDNLILNLDGLAKNLKEIGEGRVWIIGTAQQTLTEDDPRSAINAPQLFKLKDRFPIQIDLESKDIKEICYRRLLGKAPEAEKVLGKYFDDHGQALRHNTKLQDAKYYDSDFNKETFINLYPFLPAHFDILLHLLGALAKSTGGIGLRSAIKVVQDILIEGPQGYEPMAEQPVGQLATTATLYDALERDIQSAFPSRHHSVGKAMMRFPDSQIHQEVAKSVAILQILNNLPVTAHNVASLMHKAIESKSRADAVQNAINDMIADAFVPFGEQDGSLCFFSEKLNDIEQERSQIPLRAIETRRILNEAIKETFSPLPSTRIYSNLVVTAGLKSQIGNFNTSLAGERETIQTQIELADPADYDTTRDKLIEESRNRIANFTIFILGQKLPEIDDKLAEIYRCQAIVDQYRNDPEQEVKDYCKSQLERARKLNTELKTAIKKSLARGSFIFRGQALAVESLHPDVIDACKKYLGDVGAQVFDRYNEAPERAKTDLAEKFLRLKNLNGVTANTDPLELVQIQGGTPQIRTDHPALVSIR